MGFSLSALTRGPEETEALASELLPFLEQGMVVLLHGNLGAGKTTFVRGVLRALGWDGAVKSPTYNLIQTYPTSPPILHADLYRVQSAAGLDLEDLLDDHASFIEWPEAGVDLVSGREVWQVRIDWSGEDRLVEILGPEATSPHPSS